MSNRNVLIVSLNGVSENTGGGIYLRSLIDIYKTIGFNVNVFSKYISPEDVNSGGFYYARKNVLFDLVSRFFLLPSFLIPYFFVIFKMAKQCDILVFHSARLGVISYVLSLLFPSKFVVAHSDNFESKLIREVKFKRFTSRWFLKIIDVLLVPISEFLFIKCANVVSFITENDRKEISSVPLMGGALNNTTSIILPVSIKRNDSSCLSFKEKHNDLSKINVLFTGSFDFYPNIDALNSYIRYAKEIKNYNFVVAGRKLKDLINSGVYDIPDNLIFYSDVSNEQLQAIYKDAHVFFCPVKYGSGMKTKIAEALSYALPVISYSSCAYGYDKAISNGVLTLIDENESAVVLMELFNEIVSSTSTDFVYSVYLSNYTVEQSAEVLKAYIN